MKKDTFFVSIIGLVIIIIVTMTLSWSLSRKEKIECLKWEKESKEYRDYFFTTWQVEQCKYYDINLK